MKAKLLILLIYFAASGWAQIPEIIWQHCYNVNNNDKTWSICNAENGFLTALQVFNATGLPNYHGFYEILIINIEPSGNVVWEKCFGGTKTDIPIKIIQAGINEYLVLGKTFSTDGDVQSGNQGMLDFWIIKINLQGDLLWEKTYGGPGNDTPKDLLLLPDGGFLFIGEIKQGGGDISTYYGEDDIWLCRCDEQGNIEWEKTLGNQGIDVCQSISINNEGNILLAGSVQEYGGMVECDIKGAGDVWVVEMDMFGNILWQQCYGGSGYDKGYVINKINEGYIVLASTRSPDGDVAGYHDENYGFWFDDMWMIKLDYQGNINWQKCLGGTGDDDPVYMTQTSDGDFIVFGNTSSNDGDVSGNHSMPDWSYSNYDVWIAKISSEGQFEWQQCYGGLFDEKLYGQHTVIKKNDYNYVLGAQSNSGNSGDVNCGPINYGSWFTEIIRCPNYEPGIPDVPLGDDTVCTANIQESIFAIAPPANAWTFEWNLEPDMAGLITGSGLQASVLWSDEYKGVAEISVRSINYCGHSDWSQTHFTQVNTCLGTEGYWEKRLKVYPNPAKENIQFEVQRSKFGVCELHLFDVFGRQVAFKEVKSEQTILEVSGLPGGVYYYRVVLGEITYSGKIVIQR
jgi:hypothetical protein